MNKPFCIAPWIGTYLSPRGISPCCYLPPTYQGTVEEYLNSDWLKDIKDKHLSGNFDTLPHRCKLCVKNGDSGLLTELGYGKNEILTQDYLEGNGFTHVNIVPSTNCGMSCTMCLLSDKRYAEIRKMGIEEELELSDYTLTPGTLMDGWVESVLENKDNIKIFAFFGGDPTLEPMTEQVLDSLNTNTTIRYSTNGQLTKLPSGKDLIATLGRFDKVKLSVSVDGLGELGKRVRNNVSYKNLTKIIDAAKLRANFEIGICITLSISNILMADEIFEEIYETYYEKGSNVDIFANPVYEPDYAAIHNLPYSLKTMLRKKLKAYESTLTDSYKINRYQSYRSDIENILSGVFDKVAWEKYRLLQRMEVEKLNKQPISELVPVLGKYLKD